MKHITTMDGTTYINTFSYDVDNDLGLEPNKLYTFDPGTSRYVKSGRDLVDVLNEVAETHDIPPSRRREN